MIKRINFKQKKYLIALGIIFLLGLSASLIFTFRSNLISLLEKSSLNKSSSVDLAVSGAHLDLKFAIADKDQIKASQFMNNLGADPRLDQDISVELDQDSIDQLAKIMPMHLILKFEPKRLSLKSNGLALLNSAQTKYNYSLATSSASLNLVGQDETDFNLKVVEPAPLLNYGTQSGQLHISKKLDWLYPTLQKIARINIAVNGNSLNGEIELK